MAPNFAMGIKASRLDNGHGAFCHILCEAFGLSGGVPRDEKGADEEEDAHEERIRHGGRQLAPDGLEALDGDGVVDCELTGVLLRVRRVNGRSLFSHCVQGLNED